MNSSRHAPPRMISKWTSAGMRPRLLTMLMIYWGVADNDYSRQSVHSFWQWSMMISKPWMKRIEERNCHPRRALSFRNRPGATTKTALCCHHRHHWTTGNVQICVSGPSPLTLRIDWTYWMPLPTPRCPSWCTKFVKFGSDVRYQRQQSQGMIDGQLCPD